MKARRLYFDKTVLPDGGIVEMVIWQVPQPVPPTEHLLKYRLYYGKDGRRIVGYDNERGKGDRRHFQGVESRYLFVDVDRLVEDFLADIAKARGEHS